MCIPHASLALGFTRDNGPHHMPMCLSSHMPLGEERTYREAMQTMVRVRRACSEIVLMRIPVNAIAGKRATYPSHRYGNVSKEPAMIKFSTLVNTVLPKQPAHDVNFGDSPSIPGGHRPESISKGERPVIPALARVFCGSVRSTESSSGCACYQREWCKPRIIRARGGQRPPSRPGSRQNRRRTAACRLPVTRKQSQVLAVTSTNSRQYVQVVTDDTFQVDAT
jgi:hypothetical protein